MRSEVANAAFWSTWLDFLLDHLFLLVGESNFVRTKMGTSSEVFLTNFYLFSYEFDVLSHLAKCYSCPVFLHNFILWKKFWLTICFVPDICDFFNLHLSRQKTLLVVVTIMKSFCELNCIKF